MKFLKSLDISIVLHQREDHIFFVTDRIAKEYEVTGKRIPNEFTCYKNDDASIRSNLAYKEAMQKFNVRTDKSGVDMRWVLECGHCLHSCEDIPIEKLIVPGYAFALTMNAKLVHRFLRDKKRRGELEGIIDLHGLGSLLC